MMRGAGAGAVGGGGGPAGATLVVASLQLVWNHPFLTGFVMLMFTPPFFPLVVYFSPLVMSTALCIAALVSLGSQMEKIKAEGGEQLEIRLGFENGVGAWVESTRPDRREALNYHFGSSNTNTSINNINSINNNMSSNIINSINPQATEVGQWARDEEDGMVSEEAESDTSEGVPEEIISEEEEEDQWDAWVKEYEEEWEDIEDTEPIVAVTSIARHPPSPTPTPTPPPQPRQKEIVAEEQQPVLRPLVPLAPIRTGREHGSVKMVNRHVNPVDEHTKKVIPSKDGGSGTSKAHVSDAEALQSIEKLLHMELLSRPKMMEPAEVRSPDDDAGDSKHQDNNIVPADVIRHLKTGGLGSKGKDASARVRVSPVKESSSTTTTPKLQQIAGANYTEVGSSSSVPQPDDVHTARSANIERVVRPPPFSPQFLQSLQPLPPKDPPRLLHNLKPGRLGNPVEKFPEWVYARPHQERMLIGHKVSATDQTKQMQICEEKHNHHHHHVMDVTTTLEVKVASSSHSRRRAHPNRAIGLEGTTDLQQKRRQQQQQEETMSSSTLKAAIPAAKVVTHSHHPEDELAPQSIIIHDGISPAPMTSRRRRHSSHHHQQQHAAVVGTIGSGTPQRRVEEKIESVPNNNTPSSMQVEDDDEDDDDVHAEKEMASGGSQDLQVKPVLDQWGRGFSAQRSTPRKSRRKFEPRTVVSQDINNSFSLKKSSSLRNGKAIQYVDSSSDERESVTPRARRTERMNKPLVWRSRSSQTQEDTD